MPKKTKDPDGSRPAAGREKQNGTEPPPETLQIGQAIRRMRQDRGLAGADLCRRAGDLDPKTLTAVERGRIRNPSIKTLLSIARGMGVTVSDLFRRSEMALEKYFYRGTQKGAYQVDFPEWGVKAVSFTPLIPDFFCGKFILAPRRRIEDVFFKHPAPIYVSLLVGRMEVCVEGETFALTEGGNIFLNGILRHSFYNPLHRESVMMAVTAPSFFSNRVGPGNRIANQAGRRV